MCKTVASIILLIFSANAFDLSAQSNLEQYAFDFDFVEGIYLNYEEFKNNNPSIRDYSLDTEKIKSPKLKKPLYRIKKIKYSDDNGFEKKLKKKAVWGFCKDGKVYVLVEDFLSEILKIGAITYLIITTVEISSAGSYSTTGSSYGGSGKAVNNSPCLIDFQTGNYYRYNLKEFQILLQKDEQLYQEFMMIDGKKQKEYKMISFIDEFNQRNPIYFPSDKGSFGTNYYKK